MKTLLLTGWTWYIWSHWAVEALLAGHDVIILDNLSNSSEQVLEFIQKITGKAPKFYKWDLRDIRDIETVFSENTIEAVIHFAGLKAVWESCGKPFEYYENNVIGSMNLFQTMQQYNCKNIIFSSTASAYNPTAAVPFNEETPTGNTTNPYATSKYIVENILRDLAIHASLHVINLRYFNPIWAHSSGLLGENPNDTPNNLLPYVLKVASWELSKLTVFWDDYETVDGTGVRDYIHISDLVSGHMAALEYFSHHSHTPKAGFFEIFNLWRGEWNSVLEIITYAREITGKEIPYIVWPRRAGDIGSSYSQAWKAKIILWWEAKKSVYQAIEDSWKYIKHQNKKY